MTVFDIFSVFNKLHMILGLHVDNRSMIINIIMAFGMLILRLKGLGFIFFHFSSSVISNFENDIEKVSVKLKLI